MKEDVLHKKARFFAKRWITIWLAIVSVLLTVVIIAFASYTDTNKTIKRVFVASKQVSTLFTSNYLMSGANYRPVCFNPSDTKEIPVLIRNYNPTDPTQVYDGPITYTLTAELAHTNCTAYTAAEAAADEGWSNTTNPMTIEITDGTNTITLTGSTISDSLSNIVLPNTSGTQTGVRNVHEWTVTFTNIPLESDYCVTLIATPNDGSGAIQSTLGVANLPPPSKTDGWTCFLADDTSINIVNYDAFNYMITGSGGTYLKFSYDATKLQVNPVFTSYHTEAVLNDSYQGSGTGDHTGWKTIVITVQSNVNRYDLQMYKVASASPSAWSNLEPDNNDWVEFEIVQPAPAPGGGD